MGDQQTSFLTCNLCAEKYSKRTNNRTDQISAEIRKLQWNAGHKTLHVFRFLVIAIWKFSRGIDFQAQTLQKYCFRTRQ